MTSENNKSTGQVSELFAHSVRSNPFDLQTSDTHQTLYAGKETGRK